MSNEYTPDPEGLYQKYLVYRCNPDGTRGEEVRDLFVMRFADPNAQIAIQAYAFAVKDENSKLAYDLDSRLTDYCDGHSYLTTAEYVGKAASAIQGLATTIQQVLPEEA